MSNRSRFGKPVSSKRRDGREGDPERHRVVARATGRGADGGPSRPVPQAHHGYPGAWRPNALQASAAGHTSIVRRALRSRRAAHGRPGAGRAPSGRALRRPGHVGDAARGRIRPGAATAVRGADRSTRRRCAAPGPGPCPPPWPRSVRPSTAATWPGPRRGPRASATAAATAYAAPAGSACATSAGSTGTCGRAVGPVGDPLARPSPPAGTAGWSRSAPRRVRRCTTAPGSVFGRPDTRPSSGSSTPRSPPAGTTRCRRPRRPPARRLTPGGGTRSPGPRVRRSQGRRRRGGQRRYLDPGHGGPRRGRPAWPNRGDADRGPGAERSPSQAHPWLGGAAERPGPR